MTKKKDSKKEKNKKLHDFIKDGKKIFEPKDEVLLSEEEIKDLQKKAAEFNSLEDKHLRTCAEFENIRKRWDREKTDLIKFANYSLIRDLIIIVDELEHALSAIKEHESSSEINKGVEMTYSNLLKVLKNEGLEPIQAKGKKFDPHFHEIVGQREDTSEEHTVLEEAQKGYMLCDKVLRTSKVILAMEKKIPVDDQQSEEGGEEG